MTDSAPPLTLEAQMPPDPAPPDVRCGTCRFFTPKRGPTGRVMPSKQGECSWRPAWPKVWASSFVNAYGSTPCPLWARQMWCDSGSDCPCWAKKEG